MIDFLDEQRVELMIAAGRKIMDAAIAEFKPAAIVAAYSGGNDSVVSTHFAASQYDAMAVHCATSIGLQACADYVAATAERLGWDLRVRTAQPEGKPKPLDPATLPAGRWADGTTAYEEAVLNRGFPGPSQHGTMFRKLKQRSIEAFQRELKAGKPRSACILIVSGIRHDESTVRAGYKRDTQKEGSAARIWVNPFYWHTAADFEAYRQEFSLPCNPVKARIGISGECLCGCFASPGEREAIRAVEPEMGAYLDGLEDRARSLGFPWGWGGRAPSWWVDARRGQGFLFQIDDEPGFRPMCVGCNRRSAPGGEAG